jgi:two-component system phosphate regulon sensor histidine kinase PhoR
MKSRNFLPVALMTSSILLLLVLQGFWIMNSWQNAYLDLRKESNDLFRKTVSALRDSLMARSIERIDLDTISNDMVSALSFEERGARERRLNAHLRDTTKGSVVSKVQIYISAPELADSTVKDRLRPIMSKIHDGQVRENTGFVLRMFSDTLNVDSIRINYQKALVLEGYDFDFEVKKDLQSLPHDVPQGKKIGYRRLPAQDTTKIAFTPVMRSEWIRFDPVHSYAVELNGFQPVLLKQITPQILFSTFLTIITIAAFIVMYRSIRSQQRLMEIKNEFISNITHELKTPVTTVSVALEALRNFNGLENPKTTREYLDIAQGELNRLTLLTDKILKAAIYENKGVTFEPEPIDLQEVIGKVLHSMKLIFEKSKADVKYSSAGESFIISGGSIHVTNVIYNLIDNALKYSGHEPAINITLEGNGHRVVIKIADKGIGIAREYQSKIFEKFFRVPTGDVHNTKGYGLGLSYVDNVMKSHHGWINVESTPGEGSIFTLSFPRNSATWTRA